MGKLYLRPGHVQPVWAGHPWVFAQAIGRTDGAPGAGDPVTVCDPAGRVLGRGYFSPKSAIPVRILSRIAGDPLDEAWLGHRIEAAFERRRQLLGLPSEETNGYRLVHAEGDDLAGLIVDVYGDVAVVQLLTIGMKRREEAIYGHVARVTGARTILEMASARVQKVEGFTAETRVARGQDVDALRFVERGFEYEVPIDIAQKTGFYFDQRDNRGRVESLAAGRRVLDAFCYVGGFTLAAARGGAKEVLGVDASAPIVAAAGTIVHHNGWSQGAHVTRDDVKRALPTMIQEGRRFDMVVLDPPKLAPSSRHLRRARQAYRRLNARGMKLLEPGGLLVTCSCSGSMTLDELRRTVAFAARDAERDVTVLWEGSQGADHPVPVAFPEGRYLKCLFAEVH